MRIRLTTTTLFTLLAIKSVVAQSIPSQTAPPRTPEELKPVSIYITAGKKGIPITDLKPVDISISEDKVPAKIEKVSCGKTDPLLIGVLVDLSGSQHSDPHRKAHYEALVAFLSQLLTGDDKAFIVAFNDDIYKFSELTSNRDAISIAFDKLKKYEPHGSTALYDAIKAAAGADFKGQSGRRILVVEGDWEDNSSRVRSDEAVRVAQRNSATVYAILDSDGGLESKKSHKHAVDAATQAAEGTGGLLYEVVEKDDFSRVLQAIGRAITGSCRVDYLSSRSGHLKKGVKLRVEANSKATSVLYPQIRFDTNP